MPKFEISTDATVSDILESLDAWAGKTDYSSPMYLWDVLSGLRGPDMPQDNSKKSTTTALIRAAALPIMANRAGVEVASSVSWADLTRLANTEEISGHFACHIRWAAQVLLGIRIQRGEYNG